MLEKIKGKIHLSNGLKNIAKISSGTIMAQLLSLVTLPILTRIYGATIIGLWTTVIALANIIYAYSNLGLSNALMGQDSEEKVEKLYRVVTTLSTVLSILSVIVIYFFYDYDETEVGVSKLLFTLFVLEYAWSNQQIQICYSWLNRRSEYDVLMKNPLINNLSIAVIAIGLGLMGYIQYGYYLGCMAGQIVTLLHMKRKLPKEAFTRNIGEIKEVIVENKAFVQFQMPSNVLDNIKLQLPTLLIQSLFGTEMLGYFSITSRILLIPINLLALAIGRVFYRTVSEMKRAGQKLGEFTLNTMKRTMKVSLLPMIALFSVGDIAIVILFGQEWKIAGQMLRIVCCKTIFDFLFSATNTICIVIEKQKYNMISAIMQIVFILISFGMGGYVFHDIYAALILQCICMILIQLIYFCVIFKAMDVDYKIYLKYAIGTFVFILCVGFLIRQVILMLNIPFINNCL